MILFVMIASTNVILTVVTTMDEQELDGLFPLTARMRMEKPSIRICPDTIMGIHGPADVYGKCPWCGTKYESTIETPPPRKVKGAGVSAYEYHYDPDYGNSYLDY
jgi:hypothetical protein